MNTDWNIQKRSTQCQKCQNPFEGGQTLHCSLNMGEPEPHRKDFCQICWEEIKTEEGQLPFFSYWQTRFLQAQPKVKEDPVQKDQVEILLKKYIASEELEHIHLCYILAVMLERKKIFAHKDTTKEPSGKKILVYEHNKTGETYLIEDPGLKLAEIESVQRQVKALLDQELNPPEPMITDS